MLKVDRPLPIQTAETRFPDFGWIHSFVLIQFVFQILLLFPQFGMLRLPMRIGTFGLSLFLWFWLKKQPTAKHPATEPATWVMIIMGLSLFHPQSQPIVGLAQCAMYLAILGPLFWVNRLKITPQGFQWLIVMMWGFHTLSSIFGILQVYFPGQYQPFLSTNFSNLREGELMITLANGVQVLRPMGLTDAPGGAATAGFYTILLGTGLALTQRSLLIWAACAGSAAIGFACIYLSQVRSTLVLTGVCLLMLALVLLRQGRFARLTGLFGVGTAVVLTSFGWAIALGGQETLNRLSSLVADDPTTVYQANRGHFLLDTINSTSDYPLGAGLGRWGMMNTYFGQYGDPTITPVWAEIQWQGWLYDGGLPLILVYVVVLWMACHTAWKIATHRKLGDLNLWGALIFAYCIGAIALTFNYPLFISQGGMEFWLLNAALFSAVSGQSPPQPSSATQPPMSPRSMPWAHRIQSR